MDDLDLGLYGKVGGIGATALVAANAIKGLTQGSFRESENMIFESIPIWVLMVGLAIGAIGLTAVGYWFKYQDYQAKKETVVKFDRKYAVSAGLTGVTALGIGTVVLTVLAPDFITGIEIVNPVAAGTIAFVVGAILAFFIDALFFHPLADGMMAKVYVKAQKAAIEALKDKENQEALFQHFKNACAAYGIVDEKTIELINSLTKGDVDKIGDFWSLLKEAEK